MFRKVILWALAWSGVPLALYDLAGMAITVVLLAFNGSAWLALCFWLLGLTSNCFRVLYLLCSTEENGL